MSVRVLIIGGGASGMTAAIAAARQGAEVTVLEHKEQLGKKLLSTGNGRCNLTNLSMDAACYRCTDAEFPMKTIGLFPAESVLDFFHDLGVMTRSRNGYIYPYSDQALAVLCALTGELEALGVKIVLGCHPQIVRKRGEVFHVQTDLGEFTADRLILAAGSRAAPGTGSDGSGYDIAAAMGHRILTPLPALVQLRCCGKHFRRMAGIRCEARVTLETEHQTLASDRGELQLTDYGISGIPVFQVSRYASVALGEGKKVFAMIDFLPGMEEDQVLEMLYFRRQRFAMRQTEDYLNGVLNTGLASALYKIAGISASGRIREINDRSIHKLCGLIKSFASEVSGTNSFEQAQVCCGGIDTAQIDPYRMESKLVKGLYLAGEIIDVDGICGGYNLQWAWSSGFIAGRCAAGRFQ